MQARTKNKVPALTPSELPDSTLTRHDIALFLASRLEVGAEDMEVVLNLVWNYIIEAMLTGKKIKLPRIGSLERVDFKNRKVCCANTNTFKIKETHSKIHFNCSRVLKAAINGEKTIDVTYEDLPVLSLKDKLGYNIGKDLAGV